MIEFVAGQKTTASSLDCLFKCENLLNDTTQMVLLPYIYETNLLLNEAITQFDKNGYASIVPTVDLGFSYNIGRLAGGFSTGMIVDWQCQLPFVPVDMTIKECSVSII